MNATKDKQEVEKAPYTATSGPTCQFCNLVIPEYKEGKKYCNHRCKDAYHKMTVSLGKKAIEKGTIHYARLNKSPRLQRLLKFLSDLEPHTTLDIIVGAGICSVNTAICELRLNGFDIPCKLREVRDDGAKIYEYQLCMDI